MPVTDHTIALSQAEFLFTRGATYADIAMALGVNIANDLIEYHRIQKHGDHDQSSHGNRYGHFRNDEKDEKLAGGKVVEEKEVGKGINKPKVVQLDNGIKAIQKITKAKGQTGFFAPIAYNIGKAMGFDNIPPTVLMDDDITIRQEFVPKAKGTMAGFSDKKMRQMYDKEEIDQISAQKIAILDFMMHSNDRHGGNVMIDEDGKVWAIDNDSYSDNSRAEWKKERKGFSKALAGVDIDKEVLDGLQKFVTEFDPETYKGRVPEDVIKDFERRAKFVLKSGKIP